MRIDIIDAKTGKFEQFQGVHYFQAAFVFTHIDLKIVFENGSNILVKVIGFQGDKP